MYWKIIFFDFIIKENTIPGKNYHQKMVENN